MCFFDKKIKTRYQICLKNEIKSCNIPSSTVWE